MSEKHVELLKFRCSPRGYYYGGLEHFKREVIESILESYTATRLAGENAGLEVPPGAPILPIAVHILLSDNTAILVMEFPQNEDHKKAIASAVRSFLQDPTLILKANLGADSKVVAVIVASETFMSSFSTEGLSETEIKRKLAEEREDTENRTSGIMFDLQYAEPGKDEMIIYKTGPLGTTEYYKTCSMAQATEVENKLWGNLFTEKSEDIPRGSFLDPSEGEAFVSRIIKETVAIKKSQSELKNLSPEEQEKWAANIFTKESAFDTDINIDISDLFTPKKEG